jgi:hypothetical protein
METRASRPIEVLDECPSEQHKQGVIQPITKGSKLLTHKEVFFVI